MKNPAINAIRKGLVRELGSRRFQDSIKKLDEKEYVKFCLDVMEYCMPKLARVEQKNDGAIKYIVEFTDTENKDTQEEPASLPKGGNETGKEV